MEQADSVGELTENTQGRHLDQGTQERELEVRRYSSEGGAETGGLDQFFPFRYAGTLGLREPSDLSTLTQDSSCMFNENTKLGNNE